MRDVRFAVYTLHLTSYNLSDSTKRMINRCVWTGLNPGGEALWNRLRNLLFLRFSAQCCGEGHTRVCVVGEHPSRYRFGSSLRLFPLQFRLGLKAASVVGGMRLHSVAQLAVAACGFDSVLPFSGQSLCRWPPPHHKQRGGSLQFAQIWPNFLQL
jgi:hypothetical protein